MSQASPTPSRPGTDPGPPSQARARSFADVAGAYDRGRPSYPRDAADWLVGARGARVLELGAGTGKLTEVLDSAGHQVLATDPLDTMLRHLARRTTATHAVARAEQLPVASRSVDAVVCGQSFHWFDHDLALPEIARVLRPGGVLALAWNAYDESIPWVRRLHRLLNPTTGTSRDGASALMETPYFGFVEQRSFRVWQPHTARTLDDLARSTSHVSAIPEPARDELLAQVRALYDDYGRGPDGMQVPYLTQCYRAVVRHEELPPEQPVPTPLEAEGEAQPTQRPPEDPGISLIDFR